MHPYRTRFAKDIITEFLPPRRISRRVVVLCDGLPTLPSKSAVLEHFSRLGYWAFHPRYRGTWESGGRFLAREPQEDVLDMVAGLTRGFRTAWEGESFRLVPSSVHVIGSSFGGTAAVMSSLDPRVDGAVALSPVIDWTAESKAEPHAYLRQVINDGYGEAYRFSSSHWRRLTRGGFFDPVAHVQEFDGDKLLLVHADDDDVVPRAPAKRFARATGCDAVFYAHGGHLSLSAVLTPRIGRRVRGFLARKK